jgi:XTP/dITP diphosphohydrolase
MQKKIILSFLTGNSHKFFEAKEALAIYPNIELKQINQEKPEHKDDSVEDPIMEIARMAAEEAAAQFNTPIAVEDAGLFLNAYPGFPGLNTKWVIKKIGYEGYFRLLAGQDRSAFFRSVVAYCEPGGEAKLFEGKIEGTITEKVIGHDVDCMDYDRIFIPQGETRPFSLIMEAKRKMSHRKIAFQILGEYLTKRKE